MLKRFWEDELRQVILIIFSFLLWLGLTWTLNVQSLIVGGAASLIVGLVFGKLFTDEPKKVFQLRRWFWLLVYIPVFLWEMAKANFDVAGRVLVSIFRPKNMPISPGIVRIKTEVHSEIGKAFLANSITLTPGTFTVDIKNDILYVHCINVKNKDIKGATEDIAKRFDPLLIKIFD